jgi:hypothetical protein
MIWNRMTFWQSVHQSKMDSCYHTCLNSKQACLRASPFTIWKLSYALWAITIWPSLGLPRPDQTPKPTIIAYGRSITILSWENSMVGGSKWLTIASIPNQYPLYLCTIRVPIPGPAASSKTFTLAAMRNTGCTWKRQSKMTSSRTWWTIASSWICN